jgi:ribonucleoside-diphosphate reductase alpha chain
MASKFLSQEAQYHAGVNNRDEAHEAAAPTAVPAPKAGPATTATVSSTGVIVPQTSQFSTIKNQEDAPPCSTCGSIMVRSGACYKCSNCGTTSGCA